MNAIAEAAASAAPRFTKRSAEGLLLAADATEWALVHDSKHDLTWVVAESKRMKWAKAQEYCAKLEVGGRGGFRLPTIDELETLRNRDVFAPATFTEFFPNCKSAWYWSSTPLASSPSDYAWIVNFYNGYSFWTGQDYEYFVRAVRSGQ